MEEEVILDGTGAGFFSRPGTLQVDEIGVRRANLAQVSFGVAPATVAFTLGLRTNVDQLFLSFYVLCSLTRLARFNVTVAMLPKDKTGKSQYFEGTPVPFACLTTSAVMATWTFMGLIHDSIPVGTVLAGTFLEFHPTVLMFVLSGSLMVSKTLRVPKP
jgi:CDP-diacylglycerol--serine O-phosphatidyltransferase